MDISMGELDMEVCNTTSAEVVVESPGTEVCETDTTPVEMVVRLKRSRKQRKIQYSICKLLLLSPPFSSSCFCCLPNIEHNFRTSKAAKWGGTSILIAWSQWRHQIGIFLPEFKECQNFLFSAGGRSCATIITVEVKSQAILSAILDWLMTAF